MKGMTKNEFREFARVRGFATRYSGKLKKFFMTKVAKMDVMQIINSKRVGGL
jgi:hypothetical protein